MNVKLNLNIDNLDEITELLESFSDDLTTNIEQHGEKFAGGCCEDVSWNYDYDVKWLDDNPMIDQINKVDKPWCNLTSEQFQLMYDFAINGEKIGLEPYDLMLCLLDSFNTQTAERTILVTLDSDCAKKLDNLSLEYNEKHTEDEIDISDIASYLIQERCGA